MSRWKYNPIEDIFFKNRHLDPNDLEMRPLLQTRGQKRKISSLMTSEGHMTERLWQKLRSVKITSIGHQLERENEFHHFLIFPPEQNQFLWVSGWIFTHFSVCRHGLFDVTSILSRNPKSLLTCWDYTVKRNFSLFHSFGKCSQISDIKSIFARYLDLLEHPVAPMVNLFNPMLLSQRQ